MEKSKHLPTNGVVLLMLPNVHFLIWLYDKYFNVLYFWENLKKLFKYALHIK